MDADSLAALSMAYDDRETARQVLREWLPRHMQALNDDIAARRSLYTERIQAALPGLPDEQRRRLSLEWERIEAALDGATDEQLAVLDAELQTMPANEGSLEPILDVFEQSARFHDSLLSEDDIAKLAQVAGPEMDWLDDS